MLVKVKLNGNKKSFKLTKLFKLFFGFWNIKVTIFDLALVPRGQIRPNEAF